MVMLYLYGLMFSAWQRNIFISALAISCSFNGSLLPAQVNPDQMERAGAILKERGEVVFEFYPEDVSVLREINTILSVERRVSKKVDLLTGERRRSYPYTAYADSAGFKTFLDYNIPFKLIEQESRKKSWTSTDDFPGSWDVYPTHDQYVGYMEHMADEYPEICDLDTIGQSVDGRNILVIKISDNPDLHEAEPAFVYSSTMHGDETTGYVILLRLIDYLCSNYNSDPVVTNLVENIEIWINPLANPDGAYNENDGVPGYTRFNANHVDLNRNFPGIQGSEHPDGEPCQPENIAQMDFLRSINMVMGANIHDGTEVINFPFDTWASLHADDDWYRRTSREYAREAQKLSGPVLYMLDLDSGITNGWEWYEVVGTRQDWVNYHIHAREVTIEIYEDKGAPPADLPSYWYYNHSSLLRYMEHCLYGIHGMVKDENTGEPVKASIVVLDHDTLQSHIYSDSINGFFARLIEPGLWNMEISAPGYESTLITGVQVYPNQTTWLDISLKSHPTGLPEWQGVDVSPNPFIYHTDLNINVEQPGQHHILLFDMKGSLVCQKSLTFQTKGKYMYSLDGSSLKRGIYLLKIISPSGTCSRKIFKSQ